MTGSCERRPEGSSSGHASARTRLLLTDIRAAGTTACRSALRYPGDSAAVFDDGRMEVLPYRPEPLTDAQGRPMRVPWRLRWTVRDGATDIVRIDAEVDTPWRNGHGREYVSAYSDTGTWRSRPIGRTGYLEWVDCEQSSKP